MILQRYFPYLSIVFLMDIDVMFQLQLCTQAESEGFAPHQ